MSLGLVVACSDDDSIPEVTWLDSGVESTKSTDSTRSQSDTESMASTDTESMASTDTESMASTDTSTAPTTSLDVTSTGTPSTGVESTDFTSSDTFVSADSGVVDTTDQETSSETGVDVTLTLDAGLDAAVDTTPEQDASFDASTDVEDTTDPSNGWDGGLDGAVSEPPLDTDAGTPIVLTAQDFAASTASLQPDGIVDALLNATLEGAIDSLALVQTDSSGAITGETFWWSKPGQLVPAAIEVVGGETTNWNLYVFEDSVPVTSSGVMSPLPSGTHHLDIYASWVTFSGTAYFRLFALDNLGNIIDTQDFVY